MDAAAANATGAFVIQRVGLNVIPKDHIGG